MTPIATFENRLRAAIPASLIIVLASLCLPLHGTLLFDLAIPAKSVETGAVLLTGVIIATACAVLVSTMLRDWLAASWASCRAAIELPSDPDRKALDVISHFMASGGALVAYAALWTPLLLLLLLLVNPWLALSAATLVVAAGMAAWLQLEMASMLINRVASPIALTVGLMLVVSESASPGILIGASLLTGLTVGPVVALVVSRSHFRSVTIAYSIVRGRKGEAKAAPEADVFARGIKIAASVVVSALFLAAVLTAKVTPALIVGCRAVGDARDRIIKTGVNGRVAHVFVQEGEAVAGGMSLVALDVADAASTLASVKQRLMDARSDLDASTKHRAAVLAAFTALQTDAEDRVKRRIASVNELNELRAKRIAEEGQSLAELEAASTTASTALESHQIKAPGNGRVQQLTGLAVGSQVTAGDTIATIVSGTASRVECRVGDNERADLDQAQAFEVRAVQARDRFIAAQRAKLINVSPSAIEFKGQTAFVATFALDGTGPLTPGDAAELSAALPSMSGWQRFFGPIMRATNRGIH
jgi:multidrug resistance efflux pump